MDPRSARFSFSVVSLSHSRSSCARRVSSSISLCWDSSSSSVGVGSRSPLAAGPAPPLTSARDSSDESSWRRPKRRIRIPLRVEQVATGPSERVRLALQPAQQHGPLDVRNAAREGGRLDGRPGDVDTGSTARGEAPRAGRPRSPRSHRRATGPLPRSSGGWRTDQSDRSGGRPFPAGRLRPAGGATFLSRSSNSRRVGTGISAGSPCLGRVF